MRKSFILLIACFSINCLFAQRPDTSNIPPKREFRGVWMATVANIDFPKTPSLNMDKFREEWIQNMVLLEENGFNAVLAQVRPSGDAFYRSKISPWSKYLTGKAGLGPEEGFDPLVFMIEEAHKRNIEFHAWLNPYRASMDTATLSLAPMHPYKNHPEWFLSYGGKLYFNPALQEVRNYITEVVMEIIVEYKVDGVHFDDYFYPYPAGAELFPDDEDYVKYGYGYTTLADFRRGNVDKLISQVSQMKKTFSPGVKFGISPFGVWRNLDKDPLLGSATRAGINTYDDLFADVRGWLQKGWIDYVAPQLYWNIGFPVADYEVLVNWWKNNSFERVLVAGQAAYKVQNTEPAWNKPTEIPNQVRLNRSTPDVDGSIFYNFSSLRKNPLGMLDSLRENYYTAPALMPEMAYMKLPVAPAPVLDKPKFKNDTLSIKISLPNDKEKATSYLVVYRFEDRLPGDYNNPNNIHQIIHYNGENSITFKDGKTETGKVYTYTVSAVNQQHTESNLSNPRSVERKGNRLKTVK